MTDLTKSEGIGVLIEDRALWRSVSTHRRTYHSAPCGLHIFDSLESYKNSPTADIYIVLSYFQLNVQSKWSSTFSESKNIRFLVSMGSSPTQAFINVVDRLNIRSHNRLHLTNEENARFVVKRLINALCQDQRDETIMDAWWEGNSFVVKSPTFEQLYIPKDALPNALRHASVEELNEFSIDEYGDFIYWQLVDVHMGWSQFEQAIRPEAILRAEQKSHAFNRRYGQAIRELREKAGLTQTGITGLDARTVRRIESGDTRATSNAIRKLARAHNMALPEYMERVSKNLSSQATTPGASAE